MSEWRGLKTMQEVAAAQVAGDEIECDDGSGWCAWDATIWYHDSKYRARPKAETVTLRKALFNDEQFGEFAYECTEKHANSRPGFIRWLGDPVAYEVEK